MTTAQKREKIGKALAAKRKSLKLSRYKVSKNIPLSITQIKSIDTGEKAYTLDSLLIYLSALGLDVRFIEL